MLFARTWIKICISLGLLHGWISCARPRFDTSTDMGLVLVPADAEIDSVIFRLRATDQDADFPLVFDITATVTPIVRIENLPCTLYNKVCQANVILTKRLIPGRLHDFAVRVKDTKGDTNSMQATISVTNATTPRDKIFPHVPSLIMVPEDAKPGKELDYLLVRSNTWSGKPVYIELWQPKELFTIRQRQTPTQTRGVIILIGELDFETQSMYTLTVYATDPYSEPGKDTRNIAGLNLVVIVQDVQDVPPIFTLAPPLTKINNSVQPGDVILKVHAEDGDKGVPRDIIYGLVSDGNPFAPFFNISETTGEITLARPLEELTLITHVGAPVVLSVVAEEIRRSRDEPPAQATVVEVGLLLGEPGNSPPYFESDNYAATIDENVPAGTIVSFSESYSPVVKDEDIGKAGVFSLQLLKNNGTFEISPNVAERTANFMIIVRDNSLLDYETYKTLTFKIMAQEVGPATNLSATVPVTVYLRDVNDNYPEFEMQSYEVTLSENVTAGTKVTQVHATDKDTGMFGSIQFTRIIGQGSEAFNLDANTGLITVAMGAIALDREITPRLQLSVEARDENGHGHKGVVPLIVNLLDVNDNAPVFEKSEYEFMVNLDLNNFTTPAFIKATDADAEAPNNVVRYELVHGNYENKFHLDELTGELTIREPISKVRRKKQSIANVLATSLRKEVVSKGRGFTNETATNAIQQVNTTRGTSTHLTTTMGRRKRADHNDVLFVLTARAYDLGVPHLSSMTEIHVIRGPIARSRIVMFVVPEEHPDPVKTTETLATITGGRVTVQEIRPYKASNQPGGVDAGGEKKSIVVARVEQNSSDTSLVDIQKIRDALTANGFGIIGTDMTTTNMGGDGNENNPNSGNVNVNVNGTVFNEEVTVYKAENKLLMWLLIILALLALLAIILLIICCICPGCPFYMAPRKRRVHSSETLIARSDGRPKRHLHRKLLTRDDQRSRGQQAWSADPTRRNWQFNRRNTKHGALASLPGDVAYISRHEVPVNESLRLRDGPDHSVPVHNSKMDSRVYVEDIENHRGRGYDTIDIDSLRRHEMERGSDTARHVYRYGVVEDPAAKTREQHFYRKGNTEILRLVTRGQGDEDKGRTLDVDQEANVYHMDGKDILLQRFIEDQKIRHLQDMQETIQDFEGRSMESHHPKGAQIQQQEILILPDRLDVGRAHHVEEIGPSVQRLIIDHGDYENSSKREEVQFRSDEGQEMQNRERLEAMQAEKAADERVEQQYSHHEMELARQNALLTRLLLDREVRGIGTVLDTTSYLETQSLPGQVAIATQTDRTAATQTDNYVRSRSDNDESEEDSKQRKKLKIKKKYGLDEMKRSSRMFRLKSPIEEEPMFDKRLSISRLKGEDRGDKVVLETEVLREISNSLDGTESSQKDDDMRESYQTVAQYKILGDEEETPRRVPGKKKTSREVGRGSHRQMEKSENIVASTTASSDLTKKKDSEYQKEPEAVPLESQEVERKSIYKRTRRAPSQDTDTSDQSHKSIMKKASAKLSELSTTISKKASDFTQKAESVFEKGETAKKAKLKKHRQEHISTESSEFDEVPKTHRQVKDGSQDQDAEKLKKVRGKQKHKETEKAENPKEEPVKASKSSKISKAISSIPFQRVLERQQNVQGTSTSTSSERTAGKKGKEWSQKSSTDSWDEIIHRHAQNRMKLMAETSKLGKRMKGSKNVEGDGKEMEQKWNTMLSVEDNVNESGLARNELESVKNTLKKFITREIRNVVVSKDGKLEDSGKEMTVKMIDARSSEELGREEKDKRRRRSKPEGTAKDPRLEQIKSDEQGDVDEEKMSRTILELTEVLSGAVKDVKAPGLGKSSKGLAVRKETKGVKTGSDDDKVQSEGMPSEKSIDGGRVRVNAGQKMGQKGYKKGAKVASERFSSTDSNTSEKGEARGDKNGTEKRSDKATVSKEPGSNGQPSFNDKLKTESSSTPAKISEEAENGVKQAPDDTLSSEERTNRLQLVDTSRVSEGSKGTHGQSSSKQEDEQKVDRLQVEDTSPRTAQILEDIKPEEKFDLAREETGQQLQKEGEEKCEIEQDTKKQIETEQTEGAVSPVELLQSNATDGSSKKEDQKEASEGGHSMLTSGQFEEKDSSLVESAGNQEKEIKILSPETHEGSLNFPDSSTSQISEEDGVKIEVGDGGNHDIEHLNKTSEAENKTKPETDISELDNQPSRESDSNLKPEPANLMDKNDLEKGDQIFREGVSHLKDDAVESKEESKSSGDGRETEAGQGSDPGNESFREKDATLKQDPDGQLDDTKLKPEMQFFREGSPDLRDGNYRDGKESKKDQDVTQKSQDGREPELERGGSEAPRASDRDVGRFQEVGANSQQDHDARIDEKDPRTEDEFFREGVSDIMHDGKADNEGSKDKMGTIEQTERLKRDDVGISSRTDSLETPREEQFKRTSFNTSKGPTTVTAQDTDVKDPVKLQPSIDSAVSGIQVSHKTISDANEDASSKDPEEIQSPETPVAASAQVSEDTANVSVPLGDATKDPVDNRSMEDTTALSPATPETTENVSTVDDVTKHLETTQAPNALDLEFERQSLDLQLSLSSETDDTEDSDTSSDISSKTTFNTRPYQTPRHQAKDVLPKHRDEADKETIVALKNSSFEGEHRIISGPELNPENLAKTIPEKQQLQEEQQGQSSKNAIGAQEGKTRPDDQESKHKGLNVKGTKIVSTPKSEKMVTGRDGKVPPVAGRSKDAVPATKSKDAAIVDRKKVSTGKLKDDAAATGRSKDASMISKYRVDPTNVRLQGMTEPLVTGKPDGSVADSKARDHTVAKRAKDSALGVQPEDPKAEKLQKPSMDRRGTTRKKTKSISEIPTKAKPSTELSPDRDSNAKEESEERKTVNLQVPKAKVRRKSSPSAEELNLRKMESNKMEPIKGESRYMAWYKQKREEMERRREEMKKQQEEESLPRWLKRSRLGKPITGNQEEEKTTPRSRRKVKPLVNVESEQLKAIVRQGRKLRKADGGKRDDPQIQIFAPEKKPEPVAPPGARYHNLIQHSEYKYEKVQPPPFYLHPPPPVPHPSPQISPQHHELHDIMEAHSSDANRRPEDDLDSGIGVSLQGATRLRHQQLLEKKSVFDIAYSEAAPSQLRSDSTTPPS